MKVKNISKHIKKRLSILSLFSIFLLILVSFFIFSLVKHQKIQQKHQYIKLEVKGKDWSEIYYQNVGYRPPYWLLESLSLGSKEFSPDGRVIAELVDIDYFEKDNSDLDLFLTLRVETVDNFGSGRTVYKGKNIAVGEVIDFHLDNSLVFGQIIDISDSQDLLTKYKKVRIIGEIKSVSFEVANKISTGMQVSNRFNNKVYALVESKQIFLSPDSVLFKGFDHSSLRLRQDYDFRDVEVSMKLLVEEHLGNYYFAGNQVVKLGEKINVFFPDVNLREIEVKNVIETE